jgi:2-polyprenyl-3-methyl-5-hydroxy-6-metoxy-1,4-benzoquinol methylase
VQKEKTLSYPDNSFDVVTTMLVCHHMTDEEIVQFLKDSYRICKKAVIINDLQRHLLAYVSFSLIAPIIFRLAHSNGHAQQTFLFGTASNGGNSQAMGSRCRFGQKG